MGSLFFVERPHAFNERVVICPHDAYAMSRCIAGIHHTGARVVPAIHL